MPFKPVSWKPLDVISSSKLNDMVDNAEFLMDRKVGGLISNIAPNGNIRNSPRYIRENIVVNAGFRKFTPGKKFPKEQLDGKKKVVPVFEKEFFFPRNFFDPEFTPMVMCSIGVVTGVRAITWTLTDVSNVSFTVKIREFSEDINFERDMEYFINWIAIGVKLP